MTRRRTPLRRHLDNAGRVVFIVLFGLLLLGLTGGWLLWSAGVW